VEGLAKNKDWEWLSDYWNGKKYEIYRIPIPFDPYVDQPFSNIANQVYKETKGFVLFALEVSINGR